MLNIKFTFSLFILSIFIIEFNSISKAQEISYLHSGTYNFSGSIDFTLTTETLPGNVSYTEKFINCSPAGSYFILDMLAVGLGINYNYNGKYNPSTSGFNYYDVSLEYGPIIKYYFMDEKFAPYIEARYAVDIFKLVGNDKKYGYTASIGFGMNYFITKNFSLEPYIKYQYRIKEYLVFGETTPGQTYLIDKNILYGFGVDYFIN